MGGGEKKKNKGKKNSLTPKHGYGGRIWGVETEKKI